MNIVNWKTVSCVTNHFSFRLATRLNNFINAYLSLIFSLFFVAVSTSIFVLISVAGQGIVFIIKSFFYPIFATAVMVLWCIIGQILVDQVSFRYELQFHFGLNFLCDPTIKLIWVDQEYQYQIHIK